MCQTIHSHEGGNEACALQYGGQFDGIEDVTFVCPSCGRTCGPCMGCADDTPDLCDDCRAKHHGESEAGLCEYRVAGLGLLDVWRFVTGGPQMAANTARREVEKLCTQIGAA